MHELKAVKDLLLKRYEQIEILISKCEEDSDKYRIEGRLKVINRVNSILYKICYPNGDSKYVNESDIALVTKVAQKRYIELVSDTASDEKRWLERMLRTMPQSTVEDIYKDNPNRRELITPYFETDEEYIKRWLAKPYVKKGFNEGDPEFWTEKGERVRSKSEQLIANKLYTLGIPYIYEYPIRLHNGWVVYPDFKILDVANRKDIIHEHFGKMDDPEYVRKNMIKINEYAKSGLFIGDRMIATFESKEKPFSDKLFESQLKAMGLIRE